MTADQVTEKRVKVETAVEKNIVFFSNKQKSFPINFTKILINTYLDDYIVQHVSPLEQEALTVNYC